MVCTLFILSRQPISTMRASFERTFQVMGWLSLLFLTFQFSPSTGWLSLGNILHAEDVIPPKLALTNATIVTMTERGVIADGTLLVNGSKIEAVGGADLAIPDGYTKVDAADSFIAPGFIDLRSTLWLESADRDASANDGSLSIRDAIDPFDENWQEVLTAGVIAVYVQPSSRGAVGGPGILLSTWPQSKGMPAVLSGNAGLQMSMGNFRSNRERFQRYTFLKGWLQGLVDYKKKWDDYESSLKKAESEKKETTKEPSKESSKDVSKDALNESSGEKPKEKAAEKPPVKPESDLNKERALPVLKGKIPVRLEIHGVNDLRYAMELMKGFPDVQWILESADELGVSTSELTETSLPLVLQPIADPWFSGDATSLKSTSNYPALFQKHLGPVAMASFSTSSRGSKSIRSVAAAAVAAGMDPNKALHSITTVPAKLAGVEDRLGALAPGKEATFVQWTGHPLDLSSSVQRIFTEGNDRTKELALDGAMNTSQVKGASPKSSSPSAAPDQIASIPDSLPDSYSLESTQVWIDGQFTHAIVRVQGGKIASVQKVVSSDPPKMVEGASDPIRLGDTPITPGLIAPFATLGVASNAISGTESNSLPIQSRDSIDSANRARGQWGASGFYHVALAGSPSNTIAGQINLLSTVHSTAQPLAPVAIELVLAESARNPGRFPSSLAGQIKMLNELLEKGSLNTRLYLPDVASRWWAETSKGVSEKLRDRSLAALFVVREGAELDAATRVSKQWGLKAAIYGAKSMRDQLGLIAESKATLIVTPQSEDDYRWYGSDLVESAKKDIPLLFSGETGRDALRAASESVQVGVSREVVLKQLIDGPASFYRVDRPQIREGADADFVVWSGGILTGHQSKPKCIVRGKLLVESDSDLSASVQGAIR